MYSVPYSHDFHSNWLGIWIHGEKQMKNQDETLFDTMYYGDEKLGFKRQEYYEKIRPLVYSNDAEFTVTGTMDNTHKPTIDVTIR